MAVYCGSLDVYLLGGSINYKQLGMGSEASLSNFIEGTLILKAQDMIDNYVGHDFNNNSGTITLDGNGKEALPISRAGLVDAAPPRLMPVPLLTKTSITIDGGASVHASCQLYDAYIAYDRQTFCKGRQNVIIIGTWGYTSVPHDIQYVTAQICVNFLKEAIRTRTMPDLIAASITRAQPVDERGLVSILRSPKVLTVNEKEILERYRFSEIEGG